MPTQPTIKAATANIAGAARQLNTQSRNLEVLAGILSGCDLIGLQEVVSVFSADGDVVRDDLAQLMAFADLSEYHAFFFCRLDSHQHSSPLKWGGAAFVEYYEKNCRILQGDAILIKNDHFVCDSGMMPAKALHCSSRFHGIPENQRSTRGTAIPNREQCC